MEQRIVLISTYSIRKNTSAGRVPYHLATNNVSAGTQLATSASIAALFTVLKVLEQSMIASQLPVSCSVRTFSPTCSNPPGTVTPNYLASRLTSSIRGLGRVSLAVMSLLHAMPMQTGPHFSPNA